MGGDGKRFGGNSLISSVDLIGWIGLDDRFGDTVLFNGARRLPEDLRIRGVVRGKELCEAHL